MAIKLRNSFLIGIVILMIALPIPVSAAGSAKIYPTFSVVGVVQDVSVTITTYNLPAYDGFDVLMNTIGTKGLYGIHVTSISSGAGGVQTYTFNIPAALRGLRQIAIRLQSNTGSGYYAYNWFNNNPSGGGTGGIGYYPPVHYYPTFRIAAVSRNNSVTIVTHNLPANDTFEVLMGPMGTRGINGYYVTAFNTGVGGVQTLTFAIPAALHGAHQIAIRIESITGSRFFAFNWFYNNSTY